MDNIFKRPLTVDEAKQAGAFFVETRSTMLNTYFIDAIHIVRSIDEKAIHMFCPYKPYLAIGEYDNYNIGWRAWLSRPSKRTRLAHSWAQVKQCNGIGFGWEYDVDRLLYEKCIDLSDAKLSQLSSLL